MQTVRQTLHLSEGEDEGTVARKWAAWRSGQSEDLAFLVDVDPGRCGARRQAWHGAHVSTDGVDESGPDGCSHLAHGHGPSAGRALEGRVG
jgi:hypothetical protein